MATRPEIADPRGLAALEGEQPDHQQHRGGGIDIEGQHLDDERRPDIGAQHDGQRRRQGEQAAGGEGGRHQSGGGAALQDRGHHHAETEGAEAVAQGLAQEVAQIGAEGAQDPALDHMQAPEQQGNAAHQVKDDQASHICVPNGRVRIYKHLDEP